MNKQIKFKKKFQYVLIRTFIVLAVFSFINYTALKVYAVYYPADNVTNPTCAPADPTCYVSLLPDQTGNAGKFLITNGINPAWTSTTPLLIGGALTTSPLTLRSTSGVGATGADIIFQTGDNGGTEAMRVLNNGNIGIGTSTPVSKLSILTSPVASSNYGTLSLGGGAFNGVTSGYFGTASSSNALGTSLAINETSGYSGDLINTQVAGVSKFKVDGSGNLTTLGSLNSSSFNNYNRQYLRDWDAQISNIIKQTSSTQVVIDWIGDSWTTQGTFTTDISRYLRTKYGDAGVGYFSANTNSSAGMYLYSSSGVDALSASRVFAGTWTQNNPSTLGASIATQISTDTATPARITYTGYSTTVVIHYVQKSGGGDFTYAIDGGAPTTVHTAGASSLQYTTISGLTDGQHSIVLTVTSAGSSNVEIAGVELKRSQNGVRVNNLGLSGSSTSDWANANATNFQSSVSQLAPHLAVITLGVNDAGSSVTPSTYVNNLTTIINNILSARPSTSIVIFSPSDIGTITTYPISSYVSAAKAYAIANNYGFIDNYSIIGSYSSANARGLYANSSHINSIGGNILALNFENYLMNGTSMYHSDVNNLVYGDGSFIGNTTGVNNSTFGIGSMLLNTTGSYNTAVGVSTLSANTTGNYNMAFGQSALISNTTGSGNVGIGNQVLQYNTTGSNNIGIGNSTNRTTTGSSNILVGHLTGNYQNVTGSGNVGMGEETLYLLSSGDRNVSLGMFSQLAITTGSYNNTLGFYSLGLNSTGSGNVGIGDYAGYNALGSNNIFLGHQSGKYETGANSFYLNNIDESNTANDKAYSLLYGTFSGVAGSLTGQQLTVNGGFNVSGGKLGLGVVSPLLRLETVDSQASNGVGYFVNTDTGTTAEGLRIGLGAASAGATNLFTSFYQGSTSSAYGTKIGSIAGTGASGVAYNTTSDARLKENFDLSNPVTTKGLSDLLKIKVVDFDFINDPSHTKIQGFIAQDLYQSYPYAVSTNGDNGTDTLDSGKTPWMVDYGRITPLLVKSIQDMNLKVDDIATLDLAKENSVGSLVKKFLADAGNQIGDLYAHVLHSYDIQTENVHTKNLCIDDVCINKDQLIKIINSSNSGQNIIVPVPVVTPPDEAVTPPPVEAPVIAPAISDPTPPIVPPGEEPAVSPVLDSVSN